MSSALFGGRSGGTGRGKNLVEFRAGKMSMKGKMVHADKRKGLVYMYQGDDSVMHFCWKERNKATAEDDCMIFPDDAEFKTVPQCTTGRVFVLKFKNSSRREFYWMQEPKNDKDSEYCKKVNEYLNNPPTPGSSRGGGLGALGGEMGGLGTQDIQSMLSGMTQEQLMALVGGGLGGGLGGNLGSLLGTTPAAGAGRPASADTAPPSRIHSSPGPRQTPASEPPAPRPVTAAATPSATQGGADGAIQLADLQSILSGMGVDPNEAAPQKENVDLAAALPAEVLVPMLVNAEVQERLAPFLPQGESLPKTEEELTHTVTSPQFKQALSTFSLALASGQLGQVLGQFGFGPDVIKAASDGDMSAFVSAMQKELEKKENNTESKMEEDGAEKK